MDSYRINLLASTLILLLLSGCGGGGGGSDDNIPNENEETVDTQTQSIGDLTGRLFIAESTEYLDFSTGLTTEFADDDPDTLITPSRNGMEYVERIGDYGRDSRCYPAIDTVKIKIKDLRTNLTHDAFEIVEDVYGPAKLSPDGQAIALVWASQEDCPDDDVDALLTVFDRKGNIISQSTESVGTFDWLPDNRLVYANNYSVFVAQQAYQTDGQIIASLADIPGFTTRLRASPDGGKIIFEMATDTPMWLETVSYRDATVWMMNIDGSNLRLFVTDSREHDPNDSGDKPNINNPVWALNDNKVMVTEGFLSGLGQVESPYDPNDSEYVPMGHYGGTYLLSVTDDLYRLPPPEETDNIKKLPFLNSSNYHIFIAPAVEPLPEIAGSFPPHDSEGHNGGIKGSLYFVDERLDDDGTIISSMNLETGQLQEIVRLSYSDYIIWSMSHDRQYFAYSDYEYSDDKYIRIVNTQGETIKSLAMYTNDIDWYIIGRTLFSPMNSDQLLFWYRDENQDSSNDSHVALIDWRQQRILKTFSDQEYYNPLWTPDGDIILFSLNDHTVYRVNVFGDQAGDPIEQFSLPDSSLSHSISPDGTKMVFQMSRHVWTINMDGTNLKPVTAPSTGYEGYPVWSSDGRHIILKRVPNSSGNGGLYAVSNDAENIHILYPNENMNSIEDSDNSQLIVEGTMMMLP